MNGSYELNKFTENQESEVKRLKSQVELFFEKEFAIYEGIGIKDHMKIIECGSGPGYLIVNLLKKLPNLKCTALEIDSVLFEVLKGNSISGDKELFKAVHASIYNTGEDNDVYDIAITRLVIEHLDKPIDALKEMFRILKPGGKLIVVSNDFEYHVLTYPPIPELHDMYLAYCKSRIDQGGNPYVGRQIPAYFEEIKGENIKMDVAVAHNGINGDNALLKAENVNISRNLVKEGYLSQATLDNLTNKWFDMLQHPGHVLYRQLFILSCQKPLASGNNDGLSAGTKVINENLTQEALLKIEESKRDAVLGAFLASKINEFMEMKDVEIVYSKKLSDYYIDSLAATSLSSLLKSDFNINLKLSDILQNYSLLDIISQINKSLNTENGESSTDKKSFFSEGEI